MACCHQIFIKRKEKKQKNKKTKKERRKINDIVCDKYTNAFKLSAN